MNSTSRRGVVGMGFSSNRCGSFSRQQILAGGGMGIAGGGDTRAGVGN